MHPSTHSANQSSFMISLPGIQEDLIMGWVRSLTRKSNKRNGCKYYVRLVFTKLFFLVKMNSTSGACESISTLSVNYSYLYFIHCEKQRKFVQKEREDQLSIEPRTYIETCSTFYSVKILFVFNTNSTQNN